MRIKHLFFIALIIMASFEMRENMGNSVSIEFALSMTIATIIAVGFVIKNIIKVIKFCIRHYVKAAFR